MKRLITALATALVIAACGARTGLGVPQSDDVTGDGGGFDAGLDAHRDGDSDSPTDGPRDAPRDVTPDGAQKSDCTDAGVTYIYVVTSDHHLYSFNPSSASFTHIGLLSCPMPMNINTNSMAVDRKGIAYVSYFDGSLFRVSTATASCFATTFVPGQRGWGRYGMGFATDQNGPAETLYVGEANYTMPSRGLAKIDASSYAFDFIGSFSRPLGNAVELTGTGDGRLYGYFLANPGPGGYLAELDKTNATILSATGLPVGSSMASFAFAFWGGDFYFFTANMDGAPTTVTRYRPSDRSLVDVATLASTVVGAGVSTCAPQ